MAMALLLGNIAWGPCHHCGRARFETGVTVIRKILWKLDELSITAIPPPQPPPVAVRFGVPPTGDS